MGIHMSGGNGGGGAHRQFQLRLKSFSPALVPWTRASLTTPHSPQPGLSTAGKVPWESGEGRELGLRGLGSPLIWGKDGEQAMLFSVILNCVYSSNVLLVIDPGISYIWVWFR